MSININYIKSISKKSINNNVLFVDEKFNITSLKKHLSASEFSFVSDLIKIKDNKKKILKFDINSKKKIFLVSLKKK